MLYQFLITRAKYLFVCRFRLTFRSMVDSTCDAEQGNSEVQLIKMFAFQDILGLIKEGGRLISWTKGNWDNSWKLVFSDQYSRSQLPGGINGIKVFEAWCFLINSNKSKSRAKIMVVHLIISFCYYIWTVADWAFPNLD